MIARSVNNPIKLSTVTEKRAKYRKRAAIGMIQRYKKGKASVSWLKGMISDLRRRKGLTERELKEVLKVERMEEATFLL